MVADLEAKMEAERASNAQQLLDKEAEMKKLMENAGSDEEMKKKLLLEIAASKAQADNFQKDKLQRLMAEGIRQKNL